MRYRLFQSVQSMFKNTTPHSVMEQIVLPENTFKGSPATTAIGIGMSCMMGAAAVGMWIHERHFKAAANNTSDNNESLKKASR